MVEPQDISEFRQAVEQAACHLSAQSRQRAVAFFVRIGRTGRSDRSDCVELAGTYEGQACADENRVATGLPETALGTYTGEEWVRILTPRIEEEREFIWGAPGPPWSPKQWSEGVQWLLAEESRGREALGIPEGQWETDEAKQLQLDAGELVHRLREITGWRVRFGHGFWRVELWSQHNDRWQITSAEAFGSDAIKRIARLCDEVGAVTGFVAQDVAAWVLYGIAPVFERAYVEEWRYDLVTLPGVRREPDPRTGAHLRNFARSVTAVVKFRTPDITLDDLGVLRDVVRQGWQREGGMDPSDRHRLTDADRALLRAWTQAGGVGGEGRDFWEEVRRRWQLLAAADERLPPPPSKVESVRRYWYLLEKKRESGLLSHIPTDRQQANNEEEEAEG